MNMINSNYRSINIFRPNSQIHPFIKQYWNLIMISILKYTDMNPRNFWWPTFGYNKILTRSLNHPSHHQSANSVDIDTLYCSCFVIICSLITVFCLLRKLWFTRRTLWHASSFNIINSLNILINWRTESEQTKRHKKHMDRIYCHVEKTISSQSVIN